MTAHSHSQTLFAGEFRHALDAKNRITIPSRWRSGDADEFFVIPDHNNACLSVMPPPSFEAVRDRVMANSGISAAEQRIFIRQFYARARAVTADKQGRLLVPEDPCRQVGLSGEVVLVGTHDRFEVWNPERWDRYSSEHSDLYRRVADSAGL